jgi:meiotically up-regulated gene 157 (Mug157) protein
MLILMYAGDDKCQYHFLIPANMMAVSALQQVGQANAIY